MVTGRTRMGLPRATSDGSTGSAANRGIGQVGVGHAVAGLEVPDVPARHARALEAVPQGRRAGVDEVGPERLGVASGEPDLEIDPAAVGAQTDPPRKGHQLQVRGDHGAHVELSDGAPRVAAAVGVPREQVEDPAVVRIRVPGERDRPHAVARPGPDAHREAFLVQMARPLGPGRADSLVAGGRVAGRTRISRRFQSSGSPTRGARADTVTSPEGPVRTAYRSGPGVRISDANPGAAVTGGVAMESSRAATKPPTTSLADVTSAARLDGGDPCRRPPVPATSGADQPPAARAVSPVGPPGRPWHILYFFPEPHGHCALRPTLANGSSSAVTVLPRTSASPASEGAE